MAECRIWPGVRRLTGYICCDSITYEPFQQGSARLRLSSRLKLSHQTRKGKETDAQYIEEDLAMEVDEVLRENETIDGWAESSNVDG